MLAEPKRLTPCVRRDVHVDDDDGDGDDNDKHLQKMSNSLHRSRPGRHDQSRDVSYVVNEYSTSVAGSILLILEMPVALDRRTWIVLLHTKSNNVINTFFNSQETKKRRPFRGFPPGKTRKLVELVAHRDKNIQRVEVEGQYVPGKKASDS